MSMGSSLVFTMLAVVMVTNTFLPSVLSVLRLVFFANHFSSGVSARQNEFLGFFAGHFSSGVSARQTEFLGSSKPTFCTSQNARKMVQFQSRIIMLRKEMYNHSLRPRISVLVYVLNHWQYRLK